MQPTNQTVSSGSSATFTIGVGGTPPFSYSWLLNGTPIPGATDASYTTNNVPLSASGSQFSCLVSNAYGTTNSQVATLTVLALPPTITQQPLNWTAPVGGGATFSVTATGSLPLSYFWQRNGAHIAGATGTSYTTNNVQLADSGSLFSCLVSNAYGTALSSNAVLNVSTAPTDWFTELLGTTISNILAFKSFTFTPDGSANFYAVCSGPAVAFPTDPTGGTPLSEGDDTFSAISLSGGATVAIYTNRATVIYVGSNGYLTLNSGDTSFSPSYATHFSLPRVSALYRDLTLSIGGMVSWKQLADHIAVTYQAVPIYGSSTQTNSFQVELFFDGRIRITYLSLSAPSGLIGLSAGSGQPADFVASDFTTYPSCVPQPPSISVQPTNQAVPSGSSATFTISAWGTPPLRYSWLLNGAPIPGATNANYTTNNVPLSASGSQFSCVVSNGYGATNSQVATLTVLPPNLDHFAWSTIASPQSAGIPFAVTLSAQSADNVTVTDFVGPVNLTGWAGTQAFLFQADFENGDISDWTNDGGSYTRAVVTNTAAGGTHSLTLIGGTGSSHYNGVSHLLSNIQPTQVSFYVRASTTSSSGGYFVVGTGTNNSQAAVFFYMRSDGTMGLYEDAGGWHAVPYSALQWYKITLAFDWVLKRVDFYVNDALAIASIPFRGGSVAYLSRVWLYNFDYTQAWWDEIEFGESQPLAVGITPTTSGAFVNGVWAGNVTVLQGGSNVVLRADDGAGHSGLSNPFQVVSNGSPRTPMFVPGSLTHFPNGQFQFSLAGAGGSEYEILVSTNLLNWSQLVTVEMTNNACVILDTNTNLSRRFYRAMLLP